MAAGSRFRLTPLTVSSVSAIFSAMALVATAITTWISWNARDDYLESVALNEAVGRCASAVAIAGDYHRTLSSISEDLGAMTADNAAATQARLGENLARAGELGDDLADQLVWLQFVHVMRFPDEAGTTNPFAAMAERDFDLFTRFNGTIQIATDLATLPAALEPVLAEIALIGPELYGLCSDLASRR